MSWRLPLGRELSGLLYFKTGIKQYYFGFHAEFMSSGRGWEAWIQKKIEVAYYPFISINKSLQSQVNGTESSQQLSRYPPSPSPEHRAGSFQTSISSTSNDDMLIILADDWLRMDI